MLCPLNVLMGLEVSQKRARLLRRFALRDAGASGLPDMDALLSLNRPAPSRFAPRLIWAVSQVWNAFRVWLMKPWPTLQMLLLLSMMGYVCVSLTGVLVPPVRGVAQFGLSLPVVAFFALILYPPVPSFFCSVALVRSAGASPKITGFLRELVQDLPRKAGLGLIGGVMFVIPLAILLLSGSKIPPDWRIMSFLMVLLGSFALSKFWLDCAVLRLWSGGDRPFLKILSASFSDLRHLWWIFLVQHGIVVFFMLCASVLLGWFSAILMSVMGVSVLHGSIGAVDLVKSGVLMILVLLPMAVLFCAVPQVLSRLLMVDHSAIVAPSLPSHPEG